MILAASLPEFDIVGELDAPLPEGAVEAIAALLLEAVDQIEAGEGVPNLEAER